MKRILITMTVLTAFCGSAFATVDLDKCNGQYLLSAFPEAQAQVNPMILAAIADGVVTLKSYNPKVGPYAVFGLEPAVAQRSNEMVSLLRTLQQVPRAIVECDSGLILN